MLYRNTTPKTGLSGSTFARKTLSLKPVETYFDRVYLLSTTDTLTHWGPRFGMSCLQTMIANFDCKVSFEQHRAKPVCNRRQLSDELPHPGPVGTDAAL